MLFIIGGVVDAVTDTVNAITDVVSDGFGDIIEALNDALGVNLDPSVLATVVGGVTTGGMSALADGAEQFGLDSLAEEFGDATGLPVDDAVEAFNQVS
ncbi:MAG: hypothetical protein ACLFS2_02385 [Halochromatium sp.]|uniref:hypothetical protein n=1 Tax=Halochromatium sp. TaxID=2049430 RepID=UPI00397DCD88